MGAPESVALGHGGAGNGRAAGEAGLPRAAVNHELAVKVAQLAIWRLKIAQGGAARGNGGLQGLADAGGQCVALGLGEGLGGRGGVQAGVEEAF